MRSKEYNVLNFDQVLILSVDFDLVPFALWMPYLWADRTVEACLPVAWPVDPGVLGQRVERGCCLKHVTTLSACLQFSVVLL